MLFAVAVLISNPRMSEGLLGSDAFLGIEREKFGDEIFGRL